MKIQGVVTGFIIVVPAGPAVTLKALVPDVLQLREVRGLLRGEGPGFLQHGFPHLLAPLYGPCLIHPQGFEEKVLLGVHDANQIFEALAVVGGSVHMDMESAGVIHFRANSRHPPHALLEEGQIAIGQLGRDHFHLIGHALSRILIKLQVSIRGLTFRVDAGIAHELPLFPCRVLHNPGAINMFPILGGGAKIVRQSVSGLLTGDSCHLDLHAKALLLHPDHAALSFRSSSSTARIRRPMASITLTVTLFPACR